MSFCFNPRPREGAIAYAFSLYIIRPTSLKIANLVLVVSKSLIFCFIMPRSLRVRGGLEYERGIDVEVVIFAVVFYFLLPVFTEMINSNTVCVFVNNGE